jgi:hypothetical protein
MRGAKMNVIYAPKDNFKQHWLAAGGNEKGMPSFHVKETDDDRRVKESISAIRAKMTAPSISEMTKNFGSAMARWAKSGMKTVNETEYNERLSICRKCEYWKEEGIGRCMKCGCAGIKLWLATEKCPINKWFNVD